MSEWYYSGHRVYHRESAALVATAERPEWAKEIAALPDLLAALETVTVELAQCRCHRRLTASEEIALDAARAAIAKAKGL